MRLLSRFTLLLAALAVVAAAVLVVTFDRILHRIALDRIEDRLSRELEHLAEDLMRIPDRAERDVFLRQAALDLSCRITLVAPGGEVLHETGLAPEEVSRMDNHAGREEVQEAARSGIGRSHRFSTTARTVMLYEARRLADGEVLRLAVSASRLEEVERSFLWSSRAAIAGSCLLLFLAGVLAIRRFAKPVEEMTRSAAAVAAGDFDRELPEPKVEELRHLGVALRGMKATLARALAHAESERRLTSMVFERLPDGLVIVDARLQVVESNERFARMVGVPVPAGRAMYDLLRHRGLVEIFEAALKAGGPVQRTERLAEDALWEVLVIPLPEGSRAAAVGVLRDVTRLEKTEAMRRTFVADVSHELRTPIASIAAAAETLAEGDADEEESLELVRMVLRQAAHMRELIDDLMDLAQIESGAVPLERQVVPVALLLKEVAQDLEPKAREKNIPLRVSGDEHLTVIGDRRRLGQVVRNLLDNAIKFSPAGSPVDLEVIREGPRGGFLVRDRGPGIPKAERDKIFQRFYQVDRSRSKARPGTGLGLAIVKHIAHLHGGTVEVDGEPGQGSVFRVLFPPAS
jgi:two-component system phosphate regulon sensor histidine kinase PhoR